MDENFTPIVCSECGTGNTVHVISATSTTAGQQLSMCGMELGAYSDAIASGHVVGNYAPPVVIRDRVTCVECVRRSIR